MHAAFAVGVLTEILEDVDKEQFELVGLSGTSGGALCALMTWYGLAPKNNKPGSPAQAVRLLNSFWEDFVARGVPEMVLNALCYGSLRAEEIEIFGVNAPVFPSLNPYGTFYKLFAASLPSLGVRQDYFDLEDALTKACPDFGTIDWSHVSTRLLIGASEVVNGYETVFDSDVNRGLIPANKGRAPGPKAGYWRQQLPLSLHSVCASGTLPAFSEAETIAGDGRYWDGLYSQNPPVREFLDTPMDPQSGQTQSKHTYVPDELWVIRINPQQWPAAPQSNKDIRDRQNELTGNLSLNKELDFIMTVNAWNKKYAGQFATDHKNVVVRTIKMTQTTADQLSYSSKFNRSRTFMDKMRKEGREVARAWLDRWKNVGEYPQDAGY